MQITELNVLGLCLVPVKQFDQSTTVEFNGSLEKFVDIATNTLATMLFLKSKSVANLMIGILNDKGHHGYTPDMVNNLFSAMLMLSSLESHNLQLPQTALDEIKYLTTRSNIQFEIATYQLAMPVNGILVLSPVFNHTWIQYFNLYCADIVAQECKDRITRIYQHNSHLKPQPTPNYAHCA